MKKISIIVIFLFALNTTYAQQYDTLGIYSGDTVLVKHLTDSCYNTAHVFLYKYVCAANQYIAINKKANANNAVFTGTFSLPSGSVTNTMLAGLIDASTKLTGVIPFANGGIGSSAATSATTGTMTVNMTNEIITITPTGACTFNASGGVAGQRITFVITTSGTSSFVLTWGTNYKTTGTLATGTTTAKKFCVTFLYDGTVWLETNRTAAM